MGTREARPSASGCTRREALRRGLLVGSLVWVPPTLTAVSATSAAADTASAPRPHEPEGGGSVAGEVLGERVQQLPTTGSSTGVAEVAAVGGVLAAAGGALAYRGRRHPDRGRVLPRHGR